MRRSTASGTYRVPVGALNRCARHIPHGYPYHFFWSTVGTAIHWT